MAEDIIKQRAHKTVLIKDDKCYKIFEEGYNKADVLNEALNQARIEETGLNIPKLFEVTTTDRKWAIVMQYIKGKNMEQILQENPDKEKEILNRFVDIQLDVQSRRCKLLNKYSDKMNRKVSETDLSATLRYDLHKRIEEMPAYNCLCHGDFNPSNVIVSNEDDKAFIIDWSHATQGNPQADAARTYLLFLIDGLKDRANRYLTLFCDKGHYDYKECLNWLPILAASQSVKGRKDEHDLLTKLIFMDEKGLLELYEEIRD